MQKVSSLDIFNDSKLKTFGPLPKRGRGGLFFSPIYTELLIKKGYGVKTTPLEILTSYLAGTLVLGYIFDVQTPQPPLPHHLPPLSTPFSPYIDQNMAIYGLQVMASVLGMGTWFLVKSLLFGHI